MLEKTLIAKPYDSCIRLYHMRPHDDTINTYNSAATGGNSLKKKDSREIFIYDGLLVLREKIITALENGAFFNILTGPSGSGKTKFCRSVLHKNTSGWETMHLLDPAVSFLQLLATIIAHLDEHTGNRDEKFCHEDTTKLLGRIQKKIISLSETSTKILVVIDRADLMFPATLERLQELEAIRPHGRPTFSLLLVGSAILTEQLQQVALRPLQHMAELKIEMPTLSRKEVPLFIKQVLSDENKKHQKYSNELMDELYLQSEGRPGLLTHLLQKSACTIVRTDTMTDSSAKGFSFRYRQLAASMAFFLEPPWIYSFLVIPVVLVLIIFTFFPDQGRMPPAIATPEDTLPPVRQQKIAALVQKTHMTAKEKKRVHPHPDPARVQKKSEDKKPTITIEKKLKIIAEIPEKKNEYPLVAERKKAGQKWLARNSGGRFTLQLMSLAAETAEKNLERILADPALVQSLAKMYLIEKKERPHTVYLFYGSFENAEQAKRELKKLPSIIATDGAFVIKKAGAATKSGITLLKP